MVFPDALDVQRGESILEPTENVVSDGSDGDEQIDRGRRPIRVLVEYLSMQDFMVDFATNLSVGGMYIRTERPLLVGTRFYLRFRIPGMVQPIETTAKVRWVLTKREARAAGRVDDAGMGIRFDALDPDDRDRLDALIQAWI